VINRGDIFWADLGEPSNHAPAKLRPVVIIQVDEVNHTAIGTVIVSGLTSNTDAKKHIGTVFIPREVANLPKDSVVKLTELFTLDKDDLLEYIGTLPSEYILQIENELKQVLGL
jgi:mRNA interferase MazF